MALVPQSVCSWRALVLPLTTALPSPALQSLWWGHMGKDCSPLHEFSTSLFKKHSHLPHNKPLSLVLFPENWETGWQQTPCLHREDLAESLALQFSMHWVSKESFTPILLCWFLYVSNLHFRWSWDLHTFFFTQGWWLFHSLSYFDMRNFSL